MFHQVEGLWIDENVSFAGKLTGGVRVDVTRTKRYNSKGKADGVFVGGARETPAERAYGVRESDPVDTANRKAKFVEDDDRPF